MKIPKYYSIHLNEKALKENYPYLTPEEINKLSNKFENDLAKNPKDISISVFSPKDHFLITISKTMNSNILPYYLLLKGKKGEKAYIRCEEARFDGNKVTLITEFPLELHIKERHHQKWISRAVKFFRPLIIKSYESIPAEKNFSKILKKPFKEFPSMTLDTKTLYQNRSRTFADKGETSKTLLIQRRKRRDILIRKWNRELRKNKSLTDKECYYEIQNKSIDYADDRNNFHTKPEENIDQIKELYMGKKDAEGSYSGLDITTIRKVIHNKSHK